MNTSDIMRHAHSKAKKMINKLFNRLSYREALSIALKKAWKHAKEIAKIKDSDDLDFQSLI